jgi:hypothetical protein
MSRPQFGLVSRVERGADRFGCHHPGRTVIRMPVVPAGRIEREHEVRPPTSDALDEAIDNAAPRNVAEPAVRELPELLMIDPQREPVSPELRFANQSEVLSASNSWLRMTIFTPCECDGPY